jgi:LmbE family N-acetylglucosaminyl deacetylase
MCGAELNTGQLLEAAHAFAFSTLNERLGKGGLIVIAPHPDDESLGCGGLIAEACEDKRPTRVVIVTDGAGSHPNSRSHPEDRLRRLREGEARQAVSELGLDPDRDLVFLRLADRFAPSKGPEAQRAIEAIVGCAVEVRAEALFVSWRHDPHCDHQASYRIARGVLNTLPHLRIYEYSIWGSALSPATPIEEAFGGFRINIERRQAKKRLAIAAHRSQTTDLINDDPTGFRLSASDLSRFDLPYEVFFEGPR